MKTEFFTIISALFSISILLFLFNILLNKMLTKKVENLKESINTIVLFKSCLFFSFITIGYYIFENLNSLFNVLKSSFNDEDYSYVDSFKFVMIFTGVYLALSFIIFFISLFVYKLLFDNESIYVGIGKNNKENVIGFAIIFFVLLATTIKGASLLSESFIPYPTMPVFR